MADERLPGRGAGDPRHADGRGRAHPAGRADQGEDARRGARRRCRANTVQRRALDLAVEQAVLRRNISDSFVNLGRRNQNLLNRQLELHHRSREQRDRPRRARCSASTTSPPACVATPSRCWCSPASSRRGSGQRRSTSPTSCAPSLGEVEDYQRVVGSPPRARDAGRLGGDRHRARAGRADRERPHVLAARARGRGQGPADDRTATRCHHRQRRGHATEDLERANKRLAGQESFTVAPSRYLGHYVAGHLAQPPGIEVDLQDDPAGGTPPRARAAAPDQRLDARERVDGPSDALEPAAACDRARRDDDTVTAPRGSFRGRARTSGRPQRTTGRNRRFPRRRAGVCGTPDATRSRARRRATSGRVDAVGFGGLVAALGSGNGRRRHRTPMRGENGNGANGNGGNAATSASDGAASDRERPRAPHPGAQRPTSWRGCPAHEHGDRRGRASTPEDVYAFLSKFPPASSRAAPTPMGRDRRRRDDEHQPVDDARSFAWMLNGFVEQTAACASGGRLLRRSADGDVEHALRATAASSSPRSSRAW